VQLRTDFEVGRPLGHPAGGPFIVCVAINVEGLVFAPNSRY
jgi:hypothetical protein